MNILIADDDYLCRFLLSEYIKKLEHSVTITTGGQELIDTYKKDVYDLIITDICMPVVTGIDAAKHIRNIDKNVVIVASSSCDNDELQIDETFNAVLPKPVRYNDLVRLLDILK